MICKDCGSPISTKDGYVVRVPQDDPLLVVYYNAYDCKVCGCMNLGKVRKGESKKYERKVKLNE